MENVGRDEEQVAQPVNIATFWKCFGSKRSGSDDVDTIDAHHKLLRYHCLQ